MAGEGLSQRWMLEFSQVTLCPSSSRVPGRISRRDLSFNLSVSHGKDEGGVDFSVSNSLMSLCQAFEFCLLAKGFSRSA
jgi:hypothetical protein